MMSGWVLSTAAFMLGASGSIGGRRRAFDGHRVVMAATHIHRVRHWHGMTQLAEDQTAYEHENQGPDAPCHALATA
jgi:hypothetical protein